MSTLRGCKARLTNAINNLTRLVNSANSNYPTVFRSDAHPAVQLRTLQRRIEDMGNAKISIEIALETFQQRHEHAISFIENQPNAIELMDAFDIYWRDHKGDEMEPTATATIFALDDLIRKETELADMLRTTISASTTPQYNPTNTTDEPMDVTSIRNPTLTPPHMSGGSSPPYPAADTMNVQLRKVELPTFDGDFSTYYDFWAKFKTAVHDNPSLSTAAKFIHLSSSLKGSAALVVQGYDITNPSNYHLAIEALRRRYDRPQFTHNFFLQKLENLPASSAAASSQRDTLCQIQACILQLNRFEDTSTSLSLKKLIRSKFPRETQLEVNRMEHRSGTIWKMHEFLAGIDVFIQELEKLDDSHCPPPSHDQPYSALSTTYRNRSPSPEPLYDPHRCCFCGSRSHRSTRCTTSMQTYVRRMIVRNLNLCWKCVQPGHMANSCRAPNCRYCQRNHHTILCSYSSVSRFSRDRSRRSNDNRRNSRNSVRYDRYTYRSPRGRYPSRESSRERSSSRYSSSSYDYPYSPSRRHPRDRDYHHQSHRNHSPYRTSERDSERMRHRNQRRHSPSPSSAPYGVRFRANPRDSLSPVRRRNHSSPESSSHVADTDDEMHNALDCRPVDDPTTLTTSSNHQHPLLMTVKAHIRNPKTKTLETVNVMLDSGAQNSFISNAATKRLSLKPYDHKPLTVIGFGGHRSTQESGTVDATLLDAANKPFPVTLRTQEVLTSQFKPYRLSKEDKHALRTFRINPDSLTISRHVTPDILLGIDYFWEVLKKDSPKQLPSGLMLNHLTTSPSTPPRSEDDITHLWDLDRLGITEDPDPSVDKEEDARILKRFRDTAQVIDGYLHVQFPWKSSHARLADNKMLALKRLQSQYRSFQTKPTLWKTYAATFTDYLEQGIIEEVDEHQFDDHRVYYIPHQAVIKETSATTKLRVVFDASSHYRGAPSLNDCLHSGPAILPDMVGILLRSRLTPYLLIADVEKAFLQIRLQRNQRDATRFLWLRNPNLPPTADNLRIFRFTRVPFGITASPFLLAASILYYLHLEPSKPLHKEIEDNIYVDNILLSASSERQAIKKYRSSKSLFNSMHMNLREFLCNSNTVNQSIEPSDRVRNPSSVKLLGIPWNSRTDTLLIPLKTASANVCSKRTALSACSSTFDPLGLLTPFLVPFKVFIQDIWKKEYQWDTPFDQEDHQRWDELVQQLKHPLPPIPRFIASANRNTTYELAVFGDASQRLFACCAYLISRSPSTTSSQLIMAKSLLATAKLQMTMPRLELLASLISVRLARFLHHQLHLKIRTIHFFSDSKIALHWIHSSRPLKRFVQNRVNEIRTILTTFHKTDVQTKFYYVQSDSNPADCATRGLSTADAVNHIWWHGPSFLRAPQSDWPKADTDFALPQDLCPEAEHEFQALSVLPTQPYESPLRFRATSSYLKLIRSTAYVLKFIKALFLKTRIRNYTLNLATVVLSKDVSASEITNAETLLIMEHYRESESTLKRLPLDKYNAHRAADGLIRCPNRLDHARTSSQSSAPILLIPEHHFVHLLVMYHHKTRFHSGVHATIAALRTSYFIPSIKTTVTRILRLCTICRRAQGHPYRYPEMPSLPPERVNRSRPFQKVGLDYLGPLYYRDQLHSQAKIWICLFTCMATRAVHLELVHNNTAFEFLLAFRRFIARRGTPDLIISDNATTFRSANDSLQSTIYNRKAIEKISTQLANRKIEWRFITPLSPWKGGFYERLVGLFKSAFKKAIKHTLLPLSQFQTLVAEIEAVLNSRPLLSISDTSSSPHVLRPIDFVSPQVELQLPSPHHNPLYIPPNRLSEWYKETLAVLNNFWDIWYKDYLSAISARHQHRIHQGRSSPLIPSRSINQLHPLEISAKEDPRPKKSRQQLQPTRIQPPRAAKRVRFALGTKRANSVMDKQQPTTSKTARARGRETRSTSCAPMDVDIQPTFANMDARLLFSCIESLAATDPHPPSYEEPHSHRTQLHHLPHDEQPSQEIPPPTAVRRFLCPIEACEAYATGNFEPLDTLVIDQETQINSLPVHQRCALRLAQTLSLAIHLKHTFSLSHLAARDLCMVEAFIRDDYYINIRDMIVEEATLPTPSQLLYPSMQGLPIVTLVQSYRGIHETTIKLSKLTATIAERPETWQAINEVIDAIEQITTAQANIHAHRYTIDQNITAAINATPEKIATFVDHLHQFYISLPRIEHLLQAATAACAEANTILSLLFKRLRRHRAVSRESTRPRNRDEEWKDSITAPSTSTTAISTASAPTTLTTSRKSPSIDTISISSSSPGPSHKRHKGQDKPSMPPSATKPEDTTRSDRSVEQYPSTSSDTTSTSRPPREQSSCFLCNDDHYTSDCGCYNSLGERCLRMAGQGRCLRCLYLHPPGQCRRERPCGICSSNWHHPALCPKNIRVVNDVTGDLRLFFDQMVALSQRNYEAKQPRHRGYSTSSNY
ncbi:hypothetical protein RB195_011201 [Necator americanus]|uniref:Integrase core domain protein n=1 Tax=Necator americanus TaxID=51031 RepID=A0ABR1D1I7_NECAM